MTTQNNQNENEKAHDADQEKLCAEKCISIIRKFNNPTQPLSTGDFKSMLFACLHDAYVHREDSMVDDDHIATMYFLWHILHEVEDLKVNWNLPGEEEELG